MSRSYANVVTNVNPHAFVVNDNENSEEITDGIDTESFKSNAHPLYLQNIDHPGLILISKKLTGTENYGPWKRSMKIALSAKNKLGIVNGTVPRPDESSPLSAQWDRVNDMIISWILNTVSDEISNGMDFVNTAQEVWEELSGQFSSINGHRVYQVLKDLHALEQNEKSVEIYYHRMKNLWDEYNALEPSFPCSCESHKMQDDREQRKKLLQFLMGLNDSFSTARGQILMMNPLPSIAQAFSLIKQEEKQRQGNTVPNSFLAAAKHGMQTSNTKYLSNDAAGTKKSQLKCTYCQKEGHLKENCFKLVGYAPLRAEARANMAPPTHLGIRCFLKLCKFLLSKATKGTMMVARILQDLTV